MNACTSPSDMLPDATRRPPTTAIATKVRFPMNIIDGMISPEMNCAPNEDSVELGVLVLERLLRILLPAEHLDQAVPGVGLLDPGVQLAGAAPLRDELRL